MRSAALFSALVLALGLALALGVVVSFSSEVEPPDPFHVGMTGWSGWLLPLLFVAWLVMSGRLARRSTAPF